MRVEPTSLPEPLVTMGSKPCQEVWKKSEVRALTSLAAAPMTVKVADSWYSLPAGQLQGVTESVEQGGRAAVSAAGAARAIKATENFIVVGTGYSDD